MGTANNMKITKAKLKEIIKEEIKAASLNEAFGDIALGAVRKTQQVTGIGKKPWKLTGKSNSVTTAADNLLLQLQKDYSRAFDRLSNITVEGRKDGNKEVAHIKTDPLVFDAILYKDLTGEIKFDTVNLYKRKGGASRIKAAAAGLPGDKENHRDKTYVADPLAPEYRTSGGALLYGHFSQLAHGDLSVDATVKMAGILSGLTIFHFKRLRPHTNSCLWNNL